MTSIKGAVARALPDAISTRIRAWKTRKRVLNASWSVDPDLPVLKLFVKPGDVVLDVGANVGLFSKFLAELVGPSGKVISLEPVPSTFQVLKGTMSAFPQVDVRNVAASSAPGITEMVIPLHGAGHENYYRAHIVTASDATESARKLRHVVVKTIPIDTLVEPVEKVTFIKVDAEGHEPTVLKGAHRLLSARRAAWLVEAPGDPSDRTSTTGRIFDAFESYGYKPYRWTGSELVLANRQSRSTNYLFKAG